jgi:hypothetical protein
VKVVQPAAKKDCIIRTGTDIQAAEAPDRGIGSIKLDTLLSPHSLEFGTSCCVSATAWRGDFLRVSWPETDSAGAFTSKEEQI